jgi:hypothetical protein
MVSTGWKFTLFALVSAAALSGCDSGSRHEPPKAAASPGSTAPTTTSTAPPTAPTTPASPSGTAPPTSSSVAPGSSAGTAPSAILGVFSFDPTITRPANLWHLDFESLGDIFHFNCVGHGLGVRSEPADAPINRIPRELVIAAVVRRVNTAYFRTPEGVGTSGGSLHVSFTPNEPDPVQFPDGPGRDYSRICLGSRQSGCGSGTLGVETVDPGNRRAERACALDRLGTFAGRICGLNSTLGRRAGGPLTLADLKFVDGTYVLGAGSGSDDQRFQAIGAVILDWGTSIGNVVAHEIGHSVGLDHAPTGIMIATTNGRDLSDVNLPFSQDSLNTLSRNIGVQP